MSYVYSFASFACAIIGPGGVVNIGNGSGADDEGITFAPAGEKNTMTIGADGAGQHSLHADKSGKITLRLLKTSPTNALLMAMYNYQTANAANHGQNSITGTDTLRGDVVTCRQVAFAKAPDLKYAKEAGTVEWEFQAVFLDRVLGSN